MDYTFILDLGIIILCAKAFGLLSKRLGAPQVVGEIVAGLIVGPAVLNFVQVSDAIDIFAEVGVILLMFAAGLGTDLKQLIKSGPKALLIATIGVIVPLVGGMIIYGAFNGFDLPPSPGFYTSLFIGTISTATSVSITVAALQEMGKLSTEVGTAIVGAAVIDDVIGIIALTFVLSAKGTETNVWNIVFKAVLFFAIAIISGFVVYKVFKWLDKRYEHTRRIPIASLVYCLIMAFVAERYFGIADITGAYVAGVVLCNLQDASYVERRIDISAYMVFAPVFFASIGLKVSFESMNIKLLMFSICFVLVACLSKIIGCGGVSKLCRFNGSDSLKIGIGMMTRGEVALITASKGLSAGLITEEFFTPVILLILVTSISVPIILKALYKKSDKAAAHQ